MAILMKITTSFPSTPLTGNNSLRLYVLAFHLLNYFIYRNNINISRLNQAINLSLSSGRLILPGGNINFYDPCGTFIN